MSNNNLPKLPEKHHFLLRLLPSRATFGHDMTPEEQGTMQKHVNYWKEIYDRGHVVALGPVFDPKGQWGLGIIEVEDKKELQHFMDNDPAILGGVGHYEVIPMRLGMERKNIE